MPPKKKPISVKSALEKIERINALKKFPSQAAKIRKELAEKLGERKARLYSVENRLIVQRADKRASGRFITKEDLVRTSKIKTEKARLELLELLLKGFSSNSIEAKSKIEAIKNLQEQSNLFKGNFREQAKNKKNNKKS